MQTNVKIENKNDKLNLVDLRVGSFFLSEGKFCAKISLNNSGGYCDIFNFTDNIASEFPGSMKVELVLNVTIQYTL
jgi:hypothetical protein